MLKTYLSGNTIRFQATFRKFDDELIDPDSVKFIIYHKSLQMYEFPANRLSAGIYYYDYTFSREDENKKFIVEMCGTIGDNSFLEREEIVIKFMD